MSKVTELLHSDRSNPSSLNISHDKQTLFVQAAHQHLNVTGMLRILCALSAAISTRNISQSRKETSTIFSCIGGEQRMSIEQCIDIRMFLS